MITDNSDAQGRLRSQKDRITELLTKEARPNFADEIGDISQSYLSSLSQNSGAAGFNQAYQQKQQQRTQQQQQGLQNQMSLYNLMQDEVNQGNQDAVAVDKAIKDITGNDVKAYEKIASEIHNLPEPANKTNATLIASKIASKMGYKPISQSSEEAELAYKKAQTNKLNAETFRVQQETKTTSKTGTNLAPVDPILVRQIDKEVIVKNREAATTANDSLRALQSIENSLFDANGKPKVQTGKSAAFGSRLGQFIPGVDTSTYEDINSKQKELGLNVSTMLKGQTSDRDVLTSLETVPGYDKKPEANRKIIASKRAALKVISEMPKFTSQWRAKYGSTINTDEQGKTYDEAFLDWQASRFKELGGSKIKESQSNISNNYKGYSYNIK